MKRIFLCLLIVSIAQSGSAQTRYLVKFRDKDSNPFSITDPSQYLSARSIERRTRIGTGIDSTDLPVTPRYIDSVRLSGAVTILNVSKWLNQVSIQTSDAAALARISSFPFVVSSSPVAARTNTTNDLIPTGKLNPVISEMDNARVTGSTGIDDYFNYGQSYNQVHLHHGEFLHNMGLRGQSKIITLLDAGYFNYTSLKAFDSVNANGQVLGTWDFVNREAGVTEDHHHGMQCFSIIAANIPGQFVGTAPKARFYLFRSEDAATEYPIEEHNWVCAAERADSVGTDVISSSLGYNTFDGTFNTATYNHTYAQLNGNTTMAAIAADLAAKKGILVLNSAGNEGSNSWHYLITPADGDSVVAVGAVTAQGQVGNFSSYGPSSDGQVKPDVASVGVGTVLQSTSNTISSGNGTSFACPNMAGLATCLWEAFPEWNNIAIINALRQSGSNVATPNDRIGYGIPDMRKAFFILLRPLINANTVTISNCRSTINWSSKDVSSMKYEIERKLPGETSFLKVGEKQGYGAFINTETSVFHQHEFSDSLTNAQAGAVSYRIRQIADTSAADFYAEYIDTVSTNLNSSCITTGIDPLNPASENIIIAPNPAPESFTVRMNTSAPVEKLFIRVVNGKGQLVAQIQRSKPSGPANFEVSIRHLAKGKYYVSVFNGEKLLSTKELVKL